MHHSLKFPFSPLPCEILTALLAFVLLTLDTELRPLGRQTQSSGLKFHQAFGSMEIL